MTDSTDSREPIGFFDLSKDEQLLLLRYRRLTEDQKRAAFDLVGRTKNEHK